MQWLQLQLKLQEEGLANGEAVSQHYRSDVSKDASAGCTTTQTPLLCFRSLSPILYSSHQLNRKRSFLGTERIANRHSLHSLLRAISTHLHTHMFSSSSRKMSFNSALWRAHRVGDRPIEIAHNDVDPDVKFVIEQTAPPHL